MRRQNMAALVAASALALGACSGGGGGAGSNGDVELDWSFWVQSEAADASWQDLASQVNDEHPDISVNLTQVPFGDYFTRYQSQLAAGEEACIIGMQSLRLPAFAETMAPLDDPLDETGFEASEWNEGALTALQYEDEQYAVPFGFSTLQMFYNKDMFAEAGVEEPAEGWTIEEFETAAQKITESTGKPAFGQSFSDMHMFSLLYSYNGARPVTPEGELDLTNEKMQEAFEWYTSLSTDLGVAHVPASSSEVPWAEQEFEAGNVAMAVDGTWNAMPHATNADFEVGVVTLPVGSDGAHTYSANSGFGVSSTCEHPEEAVKAINVLTSEESAEESAATGNEPARLDAGDVFFEAAADSAGEDFSEQLRNASETASSSADPFISTDNWEQVTQEIARQFILAYTGDKDPRDVLSATQQAVG